MERTTTGVNSLGNCHEAVSPVSACQLLLNGKVSATPWPQDWADSNLCTRAAGAPDRGRWLQDVWFMLIPRLLRPGFRVMWEWRQQPAGMQLRVLAQILNLALVLVLEWIWVLVQVGVGRQNMKTDVDGRREGGGTGWPEWMTGRRGTIDAE